MSRLLFQPQARDALKAGIDTIADAVRPTLGPRAGAVALDDADRGGSPELLDDGGAIARRIIQLPDRGADVGAMLLREALWRQKERYGDGSATAAVIYQSVFDQGQRFISAGGNAMLLRQQLERCLRLLQDALQAQVQPLTDQAEVESLARSICGDDEAAAALADIFDALGPHSPIETREGGRDLTHEFFLGSYWEGKVPSQLIFEGQPGARLQLKNTAWLVSDFEVDDLNALVALVTDVYKSGRDSLAIVAKSFSEQIIAAQGANSRMDDFQLVYLQPTGLLDEQEGALEDLALISGGRFQRQMAGDQFDRLSPDLLGGSELAWVDRNRFGVTAAGGDPERIERELETLERWYLENDDERRAQLLRARIGRLRGGSAVIYCGGSSESEMRYRQAMIENAIASLREALLCGTLPGGGTALLHGLPALRDLQDRSADPHQRAACGILMKAASAPCQSLLINAGHEAPGIILDQILRGDNGHGYDVVAGELKDMRVGGLVDSAPALLAALRAGVGGAALALTIDTIVQRVNPPLAIEPGGLPAANDDIGNIELK